ncbi:MAG: DNA-binding protein [Azoarcus sp.]|nr:MAG: DNA-binding protein [Azoarcus sp.]
MESQKLRAPQEVRKEWLRKGLTQADWARQHGFDKATVSQVLSGKNAATRGIGHKIAVMLGIKDGEILEGHNRENA